MARRDIIKGHYVVRDRKGRIKKWHKKGRSIAMDRRKKVGDERIPSTKSGRKKSGYGHLGDYKRPRAMKRLRLLS